MLLRYSDMTTLKYIIMLIIGFSIAATVSASAGDGRDSSVWWLKTYGGLTAKDEPLVERAEQVFDKVAAAADKNAKRFPRLVVVNYAHDPYAASIQDGSIILTLGGLKLCYQGVSQPKGDARLAFVLGHELAHSAKDDYWHAAAFAAVKDYKGNSANDRKLLLKHLQNNSGQGDSEKGKEVSKVRELQADSYGLLYMAMAGYDPKVVVGQDGTNFFREWITQITGSSSFDGPGYPDSQERADFFRAQLAYIADEITLFSFGVRLFQIGKYEDSLLLLDRFREKFPSREVFGNIGLTHFQLAMKELAACDPSAPFRFKLPTLVDVKTLAPTPVTRGVSKTCGNNKSYRLGLTTAIKHLEMAASKDQQHMPTQINLASVYIFAGEYAKAMAAADMALKLSPGNSLATNCKAIALYLFGRSGGLDTTDAALAILKEAAIWNPEITDSIYNQAAIAAEREREATAKEAWKAFLVKEPTGPYAKRAMKYLGLTDEIELSKLSTNSQKSPLKLGEIKKESILFLKESDKHSFSIGRTTIDIYDKKELHALAINENIEIVVVDFEKSRSIIEFKRMYGEPMRVVKTSAGSTFVYRDCAVDVQDGELERMVFFEGNER